MSLPLDDAHVRAVRARRHGTAVFQFESRGMRDLLKRRKPDTFEDIIALAALFRPGPLGSGMVEQFMRPQARPRGGSLPAPARWNRC
jgi:DNA polymerase-3 subunit alpha